MQYWLVKANPAVFDLDENLRRGKSQTWRTKKPPKLWESGDRLFFWSSSPRRELVGLGVFKGLTGELNDDDETLYDVKYHTAPLPGRVRAAELRADAICARANFLKAAVAQGVLQVSLDEAHQMYRLMRRANDGQPDCWADIPASDAISPRDVDESALEGDLRWRLHFTRERSAALVRRKKEQVLKLHGALECEACAFDFARSYGKLGQDFCEVHHKKPLASRRGPSETKLKDLAIVCSNCHRMLHRAKSMLTVTELKRRIKNGAGR